MFTKNICIGIAVFFINFATCFSSAQYVSPYEHHQQQGSQNLYLRSILPHPNYQQRYYNPWQPAWRNRVPQNPWKRTQPWSNTPPQQVTSWSNPNPWSKPNAPAFPVQRPQQKAAPWLPNNQQLWTARQQVSQAPDTRSEYRHSTCDQCNGDCNSYLCYGCGGCQEPPPEQQTYYYPYQRQDAAYHDAFQGNEMALSGLVIWPVPKMPKEYKAGAEKKLHRSKVEHENDDDDDDDDDDDKKSKKLKKIKRDISEMY